jgi:hypothetical protein
VLRRLEAGCAAPVGITAVVSGDDVSLVAEVYALDGTRAVRVERTFARAAVAGSDGRRMPRRPLCGSFSMPGPVTSPTSRGVDDDRECTVGGNECTLGEDCAERACSCRAAVRGARVATAITARGGDPIVAPLIRRLRRATRPRAIGRSPRWRRVSTGC